MTFYINSTDSDDKYLEIPRMFPRPFFTLIWFNLTNKPPVEFLWGFLRSLYMQPEVLCFVARVAYALHIVYHYLPKEAFF